MPYKLFSRDRSAQIASYQAGIRDVALVNARLDGQLLDFGADAQIHFVIKDFLKSSSIIVQINVAVEACGVEPTPRLYLDYGTGYWEATAFALQQTSASEWIGYVPMPQMLKAARLDLTELPTRLRLRSLVAQRAVLAPLVDALLADDTKAAGRVAGSKAKAAVGFIAGFAREIAQGDETRNHVLLAAALANGFYHQPLPEAGQPDPGYLTWIERHDHLTASDVDYMNAQAAGWRSRPLLSVVMPAYDPPLALLDEAIRSLQAQVYQNWELCVADDASRDPGVRELLVNRAAEDPRVRYVFRERNGHISEASNSAAALARGDFLVLMDNDDLLPPQALWTVAHTIDANPHGRMFYSDEDKLNPDGFRCEPYFKGAFDRFLLYGQNMFSHLGVFERALFEQVGGFRKGYEGSQDYDLTLRCLEVAGEDAIVQIPHVLYHWRQIPGSTSMGPGQKNYAFEASKRAINDHFRRCGYPLASIDSEIPGIASVRTLSSTAPETVSFIIPTRDGLDDLRACIDSLLANPDPLMQIVVVDNGSVNIDTIEYLGDLSHDPHRFTVVRVDEPFNFSRLCNLGAAAARGAILCFLNNDTEVLSPGMCERARALLAIPDVGAVGARLLYPDGTVQHYGVYVGVGGHGVAEHSYLGLHDGTHVNFSKSRLMQQFSAVTGACLFVRRGDFDAVGGFDENLPVAYNDVDFCLKLREAGLKIVCDPGIRLVHKESKSRGGDVTPEKKARLDHDAALMRTKWGDAGLRDPFYSPSFSEKHADFTLARLPRDGVPWKRPTAARNPR